MDKRYQVFISSTSKDLQPARQEVSKALMQSNCFPAQMELWGAVDEEQFEYIRQIINMSDYFIVISAGMYGSIHPDTGVSFTEMEFDYATEKGVPILRFVHADPFKTLTGEFIEQSDEKRAKLEAFHDKLKTGRMCKMWSDPQELGKEVILGLNDLKNRRPGVGWVRGNGRASLEAELEVAELKKTIAEQRLELEASGTGTDLDQFEKIVNMFNYGLKNIFKPSDRSLTTGEEVLQDLLEALHIDLKLKRATEKIKTTLEELQLLYGFTQDEITPDNADSLQAIVEALGLTATSKVPRMATMIGLSPLGRRVRRYLKARSYLLAPEA